jgi:APA family basic amino acid/polyamine antiporter
VNLPIKPEHKTEPGTPAAGKDGSGFAPLLPALYIVMAAWICVVLLRYKPQYTWPGLILVLLGLPVYFVWKRAGSAMTPEIEA